MPSPTSQPWLGVEPRHLATFVAVAETGSFRGAASRLGYVQSAVSQQILQLERALATRLVDRGQGSHPVKLTRAGARLLGHAERIVDRMRAAHADLAFIADAGVFTLAFDPMVASLVPEVLNRLGLHRPTRPFELCDSASSEHARMVLDGTADAALGFNADVDSGLSHRSLRTDRWVLVAPARSALGTTVGFQDLRDLCVIESRQHPLPREVQEYASLVLPCDRTATALDLVRAGAGVTLLPRSALERADEQLRPIELDAPVPHPVVSLIWLAGRELPRFDLQVETHAEPSWVTWVAGDLTAA